MDRWQRSAAMARTLDTVRVSELTPSRRDFSQYVATQRRGLAVIAKLPPGDEAELIARAMAWDDAEVAALALDDLSVGRTVAASVTAPLFWDLPLLEANQVYYARLHQADAVLLPAAHLGADATQDLLALAGSMHMAAVVEVAQASDLTAVPARPQVAVGIRLSQRHIAPLVPRGQTVVWLDEIGALADCEALRGIVDAVVLGSLLCESEDVGQLVARLGSP